MMKLQVPIRSYQDIFTYYAFHFNHYTKSCMCVCKGTRVLCMCMYIYACHTHMRTRPLKLNENYSPQLANRAIFINYKHNNTQSKTILSHTENLSLNFYLCTHLFK